MVFAQACAAGKTDQPGEDEPETGSGQARFPYLELVPRHRKVQEALSSQLRNGTDPYDGSSRSVVSWVNRSA